MFGFILFLLLLFFIIPAVRFGWRIHTMRRQYNDAVRQQQEAFRSARRANRPGGWSAPAEPRRKVVNRTEGEYVEWEEVTETTSADPADSTGGKSRQRVSRYISEQITDVDFEEISDR